MTVSAPFGRHWKSGPRTRLCPPPSISRSVSRKLAKELPKSFRPRPMATREEKSWSARLDPLGPGRMTLPPPRSSVTRTVYRALPASPVARSPQRGEVMVRV